MTPKFQVVRDIVASHDALIRIFERINFFLQRLNVYTEIPLTNDFTELLGKIMAELLSILAISTKEMTGRKMSELIRSPSVLLADYSLEKFLKRLVGNAVVEDGLQRLDALTKEETLMAVTRNLEVAHHIDGNVMAVKGIVDNIDGNVKASKEVIRGIDGNVKETKGAIRDVDGNVKETKALTENIDDNVKVTKALTEDVGDNVKMIQGVACSVDDNVKATKDGTQHFKFLSVDMHILTLLFNFLPQTVTDQLRRSFHLYGTLLVVNAESHSQGTSCKRSFEHGSLLQIPPSITTSLAKLSMEGPLAGLPKVPHIETGRRMVPYCGSKEIVRPSYPFFLPLIC